MLIVGAELVRRLLPMADCIRLMEQAFRAASDGSSVQGLRAIIPVSGSAGGVLGVMPGAMCAPPCFGVKVVSVRHGGGGQSHQGGVLLFSAESFAPVALLHAGEITAIRTAAATAVATRALARKEARVLAILGTGEQAGTHLRALTVERDWDEIRVWGRSLAKAKALVDAVGGEVSGRLVAVAGVAEAVAGAGVVCAVTNAATPIFTADMLEAGMHLNLVGASVPGTREVDGATMAAGLLFVDNEAIARTASGDFMLALAEGAIGAGHIRCELGGVLLGHVAGRGDDAKVTIFKSLGMPVEDLVVAEFVYRAATREGAGTVAVW
jgi:ornithine cyclodeaminase